MLQKRESALRAPELTVSTRLPRKRLRGRRVETPAMRLRKDRGRGKEDRGPVKTERHETRLTLPAKITGVCEISL